MKILSIETSCDETAMSIINFKSKTKFHIISDLVVSQIDIHKKYGGVYPKLAKREHISNIFPIFIASLKKAKLLKKRKINKKISEKEKKKLKKIFNYDKNNLELIIDFYTKYKKPNINYLSVTYGPGLEMALWTGFNFARAISFLFHITLIPVNHMEGHIFSTLIKKEKRNQFKISKFQKPALALLISGGHTELQLIKNNGKYQKIGGTLDDAVGEAYDKVARLIGLEYPGGPQISKLSVMKKEKINIQLPRPMLHKDNFNFSFSGLKTSVIYLVKAQKKINLKFKKELASEFENAVSEVLIKKTLKAIKKYNIKTLIIGGGVSANDRLRADFKNTCSQNNIDLFLSEKKYTGDNALMIAIAGHQRILNNNFPKKINKVNGNLNL